MTLRLVRLALVHPLWGDECFVVANLIGRGYRELLRPLDYQQVAPILFLWAERAMVDWLGVSEWSVRVVPTLASVASLLVFRRAAGRLVGGMPMLLAVAIVAVAANPIRHSGEAKPYSLDFFAATVLFALAVEWWRRPERAGWLWALAGASPLAMGWSLPSVFVAGGIGLAIGPGVVRGRRGRVILAYLAFLAATLGGFTVVMALNRGVEAEAIRAYMDHYWAGFFPPMDHPGRWLGWMVRAHVGFLFAYPVGGASGASLGTMICVVAGSIFLVGRGRGVIVAATLSPLGLALAASSLRRYPYGDNERIMQFAGPALCLLAGVGAGTMLGRLGRPGAYRRWSVGLVGALAVLGVGELVADVARPYKTVADLRARDFARQFWAEVGRDAVPACARVDLGLDFEGGPPHDGRSADYLCYRRIFSGRSPLDWRSASADRPLRCIMYDGLPADSPLFERWMAAMNRHYRLVGAETLRANPGVCPKGVTTEDHYAVLEFVPLGVPVDPVLLAREARDRGDRTETTGSGPSGIRY